MKNNIFRFIPFLLILSLLLTGCDMFLMNAPTPTIEFAATETQNALRTEAAVTVAAAMTEEASANMTASAEPSPTLTERPTATPIPTQTQTPQPTQTPEPATNTPTVEPSNTVIVPSMTTAPVEYKCNLARTEPFYKAVFSPGEYFEVHWILENSGTETWFNEFVSGKYRNGTPMHGSDTFNINHAVRPFETYDVYMTMQAPWYPGEYSAVWTLIRKSKAFCWFSVDIVVEE